MSETLVRAQFQLLELELCVLLIFLFSRKSVDDECFQVSQRAFCHHCNKYHALLVEAESVLFFDYALLYINNTGMQRQDSFNARVALCLELICQRSFLQ